MLVGNGGSGCARSIIDITTWPLRIDREAQLHHALFAARLRIAGIALERGWELARQPRQLGDIAGDPSRIVATIKQTAA
jgi:hypothetical protein